VDNRRVVKQNPSAGKAERGILKDPAILIDKSG